MMNQASQPHRSANFSRVPAYYRPHLPQILMGVVFLIGASLMEPLIPAMMKLLLDHTASSNHSVEVRSWPVWGPPLAVIGVIGVRSLMVFLANLSLGSATNKAVLGIQSDAFRNLLTCELSVYQKESASSLNLAIQNESRVAGQSFVSVVQDGGRNLLTFLALTGYLFWMNWRLTLVTLAVMPLTAFLIRKIGLRIRRLHEGLIKTDEAVGYAIEENVAGNRVIRLYGAQKKQGERLLSLLEQRRARLTRALVASTAMTPVTQIAASLSLAMILAIALSENKSGGLTVGGLAAYVTGMLMLIAPLKGLGDTVPAFQRGRVAVERVCELMDYESEPKGGNYAPASTEGNIRFESIELTYPSMDRPAVAGVNLEIRSRQMVALVGASGSGKTSLANMLPCFIRPSKGRICVDNVDIRDWNLSALRAQIAMVSQDTVLFNDTILANVCLAVDEPNEGRAVEALKRAYLWDFVSSLPEGIYTNVGHNGQSLSGGQRQRLSIARALYKNAPILILDEATSALDSESEVVIQRAISEITHHCTMLVVAHRLSTIRHADVIVVMHEGSVVEQGSYEELMNKNNWFARLVGHQIAP